MKRTPNEYNIDHLVAKSEWWSNHFINRKRKKKIEHKWKHDYLWTKLFHDQIIAIIDDNYQILCSDTRDMVKEEIEEILKYYMTYEELYNVKAFKNNIHPKLWEQE